MAYRPACPSCGKTTKTFCAAMTDMGYLLVKGKEWMRVDAPFYDMVFCCHCHELYHVDDLPDDTLAGPYRIIWQDIDISSNRHCDCTACHKDRIRGTLEEWMG